MFVWQKKNKSGVISVQVIDKSQRRVLKTIGSSSNEDEVTRLTVLGEEWIRKHSSVREIDFTDYCH